MTGFSYPEGLLETVHAFRQGASKPPRRDHPVPALITSSSSRGIALAIRKTCLVERV